jgi:hypothetical protein
MDDVDQQLAQLKQLEQQFRRILDDLEQRGLPQFKELFERLMNDA